jgi:hypothetical protein
LEKELDALDNEYAADDKKRMRLRGWDNAADDSIQQDMAHDDRMEYIKDNKRQTEIMQQIRIGLVDYGKGNNYISETKAHSRLGETVGHAYQFGKLERTSDRDFRSFFNWHWQNKPLATASGSADLLSHQDDFVSLSVRKQEGQVFKNLVVWLFQWAPSWARKVSRSHQALL